MRDSPVASGGRAGILCLMVPSTRLPGQTTSLVQRWCRLVALMSCCLSTSSAAQGLDDALTVNITKPLHELHIARLVFEHGSHSNWGPGRAWWRIDWPEAEAHLTAGIARYTAIDVAEDSAHVSLLDDALFDFPWLFAQQVGRWQLSDAEVANLREYLLRGGFLVVDDFHGDFQWQVFEDVARRTLPDHRIVDITPGDRLMSIVYDLDQATQIPGRRHLRRGTDGAVEAYMPDGPPRWRGIRDRDGRLMVAINFNMDMGDAWEHANDPVYPLSMTSLAYRMGMNYIVYAMTH